MKVDAVSEMTIVHKRIELPDNCKCGSSFLKPGSLKVWEFQDQSRPACAEKDQDLLVTEDIDVLPRAGETFVGYVSIWCARCNIELFATKITEETVV